MTRTEETFQEAVLALREWLDFLAEQEKALQEQLERARRRAEAPPVVEEVEEDGVPAGAAPSDEAKADQAEPWF